MACSRLSRTAPTWFPPLCCPSCGVFTTWTRPAPPSDYARGDVAALAYHTERGRVHDSTEAELPAVAADWWAARRDQDTIITAPTLPSRSRHQLGDRRTTPHRWGDRRGGAGRGGHHHPGG